MKIALIGYGKMGKEIEKIAVARGHEIVSIIDINNRQDFESEARWCISTLPTQSTPCILILALKKSAPACGLGSPGSMTSMDSPSGVCRCCRGKSLCFHT